MYKAFNLSFFKEKLEIICFSLIAKLFKNNNLKKTKSGEEIASLGVRRMVPGPFAGGEEIPLGFFAGTG
jgi:hypothetical protein